MVHVGGRDTEFTVAVALPLPLSPSLCLSRGYDDQQPTRWLPRSLVYYLLLHLCVFRTLGVVIAATATGGLDRMDGQNMRRRGEL